ncbi:hypothetical protein GE061_015170 [Apolygus lucorum]|uniref:Major facilitator superfamily (MFS) profile domain-containing protein n=1 Tax=Apolygus lucorum TaxID=248454 RepID=A0A8S9XKB1_APOLU|nr:hypothetical protein GE061_015170 [Apolygus lucorum]
MRKLLLFFFKYTKLYFIIISSCVPTRWYSHVCSFSHPIEKLSCYLLLCTKYLKNYEVLFEKVEELEMSSGCCNIVRNLFRRRSGDGEAEPLITTPRSQASQLPQFIAALAATLGGFVMGSQLGWTSPTKAEMVAKYSMSDLDWSWVSGILPAGAMVGALAAGSICDQIGRRMTIIVTVIPSTVGWAMILWAPGTWMVILGRAVLGSVSGVLSCACPLYTNEIAETAIRGTLGTFFQLQVTLGILFSYIVGALIKVTPFSIVCVVIPFVPSIIMFFMPESPTYYLKKGNNIAAKNALQRLRGGRYNVDNEIATTQKILEEVEAQKMSFAQAFSTTAAKNGLTIGLAVMFFQQFSGINGVIFHASSIFKDAGTSVDGNTAAIVTGIFSVVGTLISTQIIDRLGRKPLLFTSDVFMAASAALLGIFFFLKDGKYELAEDTIVKTVPLIAVCVFIFMFAIGYGPIPWMFIAEIFPPAIKGPASSIACFFNWICAFSVSFGFPLMNSSLGGAWTFFIFSVGSKLGESRASRIYLALSCVCVRRMGCERDCESVF